MRTTTELTARFDLDIAVIKGDFNDYRDFVECDALDCDTVPFESVEADLSIELYEQDEAEMRELDAERGLCTCCGARPWTEDGLLLVGTKLYCSKCFNEALEARLFTKEGIRQQAQEMQRKYRAYRKRRLAALEEAMRIAPHMNWAPYKQELTFLRYHCA